MHLIFDNLGALRDAVVWAVKALPARPAAPILTGMRITAADDGKVTFGAFDYDLHAAAVAEGATIREPGDVLITGKLLAGILAALAPGKPVEMATTDDGRVTITSGAAKFTLMTLPLDDYPAFPPMPDAAGTIAGDLLARAVTQVAPAASRDDTLPAINAVRTEFSNDMLTMVSTDRYRLAVRETPWVTELTDPPPALHIPAPVLQSMIKDVPSEATVAIHVATDGGGKVTMGGFSFAGRTLTTRVIDADFPKWARLLPAADSITATATIDPDLFLDTVRRCTIVAGRNEGVHLTFADGQVHVAASDGEAASATEDVDGKLVGQDQGATFNPHYLTDAINACRTPGAEADRVSVLFQEGAQAPVMLVPAAEAKTAGDYRHLLMRIRVGTAS